MEERAEELDRGRIRPVDVVEDEHHWLGLRKRLEQNTDGAVAAVPLVLDRRPSSGCEASQRWEDGRELRPYVVFERVEAARVEAVDVLVERVDEDPEREVELELRRPARQDEVPALVCTGSQLREQARLPDSRLAHQLERR